MRGFRQAGGEGQRIPDEGIGNAVAIRINIFGRKRFRFFGNAAKFGGEQFDAVFCGFEAFDCHRAALLYEGVFDGLSAAEAGFFCIDGGLKTGKTPLQIAERVGADTLDFQTAFNLRGQEIGKSTVPDNWTLPWASFSLVSVIFLVQTVPSVSQMPSLAAITHLPSFV